MPSDLLAATRRQIGAPFKSLGRDIVCLGAVLLVTQIANAAFRNTVIELRPSKSDSDDANLADAFRQAAILIARSQPATIQLYPGTYRFHKPIEIGPSLSGTVGSPLRIVGISDVRLTGTVRAEIAGAEATALMAQLPANSRAHAKAYRIPRNILAGALTKRQRTSQLPPQAASIWVQQGVDPLVESRWPNTRYQAYSPDIPQPASATSVAIYVDAERAKRWLLSDQIWASGYWSYDWLYEILHVKEIKSNGTLSIDRPGVSYREAPTVRYRIRNSISEIDQPGEFAYTSNGFLVVWPRMGDQPVELAALDDLLLINNAHDVLIEGVALTGVRGSGLVVRESNRIVFSDGFIGGVGGTAVTIDGGHENRVMKSVIANTGEGGVSLSGGDRLSLDRTRNSISNSIISHVGELIETYRPAIRLDGVGQRAVGNFISSVPHAAIIFQGNEHYIAGNEITSVAQQSGDAGAIYSGRDLTSRGSIVEHNYLHDINRPSGLSDMTARSDVRGVYLDDYTSGIAVRQNLFVRVTWPIWLNSGSHNTISSNIFVDCATSTVTLHDMTTLWNRALGDAARRSIARLNVAISARYGITAASLTKDGGSALDNRIGTNWFVNSGGLGLASTLLAKQRIAVQVKSAHVQLPGDRGIPALSSWLRSKAPKLSRFVKPSLDRRSALGKLRYRALETKLR